MNHQILILAAGACSRFEPYNFSGQHKSMLSVCGRPVLEHVILELKKINPKEIIIVINKTGQDIKKYFGSGREFGVKINYAIQPEAKGMGSAILAVKNLLNGNFIVINPSHVNAASLINVLFNDRNTKKTDAILLGKKDNEVWRYGAAKVKNNRLIQIIEKPAQTNGQSIRVVGVYKLTPEFLNYLEKTPRREYQFEEALNRFTKERQVGLTLTDQKTFSLKYPWDLLKISDFLLKNQNREISPKARLAKNVIVDGPVIIEEGAIIKENSIINGPAYIGRNVRIGKNCLIRESSLENGVNIGSFMKIERSIIMENTRTDSGCISDSVIGRNCIIGANFKTRNLKSDRKPIDVVIKNKKISSGRRKLGVIMGHNVKVENKVSVTPGAIVSSNSKILAA